jgi:hypothetical protein
VKSAQTKNAVKEEYNERFADERDAYEQRINTLEDELNEAFKNNDTAKAIKIIKEKKAIETKQKAPADSLIRLTPAELESLIEKTVKGVEEEDNKSHMEERLERMEQLLIDLNQKPAADVQKRTFDTQQNPSVEKSIQDTAVFQPSNNAITQRLVDEINNLKKELKSQNANIEALSKQQSEIEDEYNKGNNNNRDKVVIIPKSNPDSYNVNPDRNYGFNNNNRGPITSELSIFLGPSFGDATTFNAGVRLNYPINNTRIYFMPEAYAALGKTNGFGLNANAVYPFEINKPRFTPYAGLGAGINNVGSNFSFNTNVILGTTYHLGNANLFADYTIRGAFRYNQIALGYRFIF